MGDKQLDLGQYKLQHLTDMEQVNGGEEVETLLTPGPSMAVGTEQQKIADIETVLTYDDREDRYLGEISGPNYDQFEQSTLDADVPIETEQTKITDYRPRPRVASD